MKSGQQRLLMEMCENLHSMRDQGEPLEGAEDNVLVLTTLMKEGMTTEQMGFEVDAKSKPRADALEVREHEIPIDEPNQPEPRDEGMRERREDEAEQEGHLVVGQRLPETGQ